MLCWKTKSLDAVSKDFIRWFFQFLTDSDRYDFKGAFNYAQSRVEVQVNQRGMCEFKLTEPAYYLRYPGRGYYHEQMPVEDENRVRTRLNASPMPAGVPTLFHDCKQYLPEEFAVSRIQLKHGDRVKLGVPAVEAAEIAHEYEIRWSSGQLPLRAAVPTWPAFHALALLSASPDAQATCLLLCAQRTGSGEGRISRRHTLKLFARNAAHPQMRAKLTQLLQLTKLFDNINPFTEAEVGDWVLPDEVRSATRENAHDTVRSGTTARAAVARA